VRRLALLLLAGALSCGRALPPSDFTLTIGVVGGLGEVRPDAHSGGAALATDLVFENLVRPVPGGWTSSLLHRWERVGPRRWRLELKEGARYSSGGPVEVADVAGALRLRGLRVLETSSHGLLVESSGGGPLEAELALAVVARQEGTGYVGTGPFTVAERRPDRLVLTRSQPAPGRIQRVEIVPVANGREALVRLLRRELGAVPSLDAAQVELLDGVPGLRIVRGSAPHATAVMLSPRLPAAERRELARAIPVAEIAAAIRREPCCSEGGSKRVAAPPSGRPLRIGYPRSILFRRAALALRQGLGARGGAVVPFGASELEQGSREFDLVLTSMLVRPPGVLPNYLRTGAPWNFTGYSNPRYDAALVAGDEVAAEEALAEDPAFVLVGRRERVGAVDARLANARFGDWGILELLPQWEVSP